MSLVILTFDAKVADWAVRVTARINSLLNVHVITPEDCPRWTDVDWVREPERAVLAAVEGREEGRLEARAGVIVDLLTIRGLPPDPETRERILACRQPETLARWLTAALEVTQADELFGR